MTDKIDTTPEAVNWHLDISHNHEAGLIPMSTQTMMRAVSTRIEELEAHLAKAMEVVKMIASADVDAVLGQAVDLSCEIIADLMEDEDDE